MKLNYRKAFLVGLGFFSVTIILAIYNNAVPLYLRDLGLSGFAVAAVMSIDNVFAVILQPIFGIMSDKTNTRYGRRMPYLLLGIPLTAFFFLLVPFARTHLIFLMLVVILLNFSMSLYRTPTVALMPDMTPSPLRNRANGVMNLMGGAGTVLALVLSGTLFKVSEYYPYAAASLILLICIILIYNFLKEPPVPQSEAEQKDTQDSPRDKGQFLSLLFLLLAIFFWFAGYSAIETFFSTYGQVVLKIDKSTSAYLIATVSATFLLVSIPAGILASKLGRKKVIMMGLCLMISVLVLLIFVKSLPAMFVILGAAGVFWALVTINSYPMVVEMTSSRSIGKLTGMYYFFSMLAAIASPVLYGFLKDMLGDGLLFIYASVCMVIALFFMMLVKHGESNASHDSITNGPGMDADLDHSRLNEDS